jgi:lipopolysaccharide transport system permease protein
MRRYRDLLYALTLRDIKVRYKQSLIGFLWAVINPLALMFMFDLVFGKFLGVSSEGYPYAIFAFSSLIFWSYFAACLGRGTMSIVGDGGLIKKIKFPAEVFPISSVIGSLFMDLIPPLVVFIGMMVYYGVMPTMFLLYLPLLLGIQVLLSIGLCFWLSAVNTYWRDVGFALPLVIQVGFFACPIAYPLSQVPARLHTLYILNPMVGLMDGYRSILLKGQAPGAVALELSIISTVVVLVTGYLVFKRLAPKFADIV